MGKAKILVVEDEAIIASDLQWRLQSMGYDVPSIVASGEDAVSKVWEIKPDLVLMDIMLLGEIDGIEAASRIHSVNDTPVIYLTSYADEELLERAKITEPFAYMIKPIGDRELFSSIELSLSKHLTERKLRENKKWLSTVLSSIGDAVITTDTKGNIVFMNPAAEVLTGWNKEEASGRDIEEIINIVNEITGERIISPLQKVLRYKAVMNLAEHSVLITKSGVKIPIDDSSAPIKDEEDNVTGVVFVLSDITERRQSEKFIRSILESVGEGFIVIDKDYRILSANRAFCEYVKRPVDEVTGKKCFEISHYVNKPCYEHGEECPVKHTFETGKPHTVTHTHFDNDGRPSFVEIRSYPMKNDSGETISVIELINDITEKKRLESQLRQAQKMEAVGLLASGVSHDFNNILTAIVGYGNLLKIKMKEDDPLRHNVYQILASVERGANLTHSLLAFSRKQVMNPQPVNFNTLVESVYELLKRLIGEDIELKTILTHEDVTVMADSGQIEQVLMNLATNARDAMPDGGRLTIETERIEINESYVAGHGFGVPGIYVQISVTDSGTGMNEATKAKIFEPFFSTKEVGRGTGLGLAMIYGIIKQHNGYINVYSEPGEGTTFKIYLPVIKAKIEKSSQAEVPASVGGTETILLSEDDQAARELTKTVLQEFGYTVIDAENGEDAVNKFMANKNSIKLLILDVIMPKKNGPEVFNEIKASVPDIKAIFISGYTTDEIHKKRLIEGDINFVSKPFSPQVILQKTREVLDGK
ncbi:MAG: response regulator [Nitrospiraceae bacterium]|nr:MAG: response regulator [Nitrospiraceae bacterium]